MIAIQVRRSIFSIRLSAKNQAQRSSYLEARRQALPAFQSLNFHTQQHTEVAPSRATSPELICVDQGESDPDQVHLVQGEHIKQGLASDVVRITNVCSQVTYAGKRSIGTSQEAWRRELEILQLLQHVSSPFLVSFFIY